MSERIAIVHNPTHKLHLPRKIDGCENPQRVDDILKLVTAPDIYRTFEPSNRDNVSSSALSIIHSLEMISAIRRASELASSEMPQDTLFNKDQDHLNTPIYPGTYNAVMAAVSCGVLASSLINQGYDKVFSITRPPSHHAGYSFYQGFCFLNHVMFTAHRLSQHKNARIAVLDTDHHHGNGHQDIVNTTGRVHYVSIHSHPYKNFPGTGYSSDFGSGLGRGMSHNFPYDLGCSKEAYLKVLHQAFNQLNLIRPDIIVVSAGFDAHVDDHPPCVQSPTLVDDTVFEETGALLNRLTIPTLVTLEGGYGPHLTTSFESLFTSLSKNVQYR